MTALAIGISAAAFCVCGLVGFRWWLAHREKSFAHAPLAVMEQRIAEIENRLLAGSMTGGRR